MKLIMHFLRFLLLLLQWPVMVATSPIWLPLIVTLTIYDGLRDLWEDAA